MKATVKGLREFITEGVKVPEHWDLRVIVNEDHLTYLAFNTQTHEALWVDPVREDLPLLQAEVQKLAGYRWVAVIDTHTHADHISGAADLAAILNVPLVMHALSPTRRAHLRIQLDTVVPTASAPIQFILTPGHTPDSMCVIWGPFLFTGDHILYGDTGRDDLPGGDPAAHYESLQKVKAVAQPEQLFLPGHGTRGSTWKTQLEKNAALTQSREVFVPEAAAYTGPAPKLLKESLFENFK
jgi:glyoxylase-like metal-dependent hydrolase (beta-lactamase superfamily II)